MHCSPDKSKVLVIITGGTVCMAPEALDGVNMSQLSCAPLESVIRSIPEFNDPSLPDFDVLEWEKLIDSSDCTSEHWNVLAKQIEENYELYDGFVVLHGTDTLAFTSSALSFMLEGLKKTVVVTGAMLPIGHITTDARRNIAVSLLVAAYSALKEVVVCFGSRILKGNRVAKLDCANLDAFDTPNSGRMGSVGIAINLEIAFSDGVPAASGPARSPASSSSASPACIRSRTSSDPTAEISEPPPPMKAFTHMLTDHVAVLRITPSFNPMIIRQLSVAETRPFGIILQLYGTGTAPSNQRFLNAIEFAIQCKVTIVAVTQCERGSCSLKTYANGNMLHELGVIEGKDLTTEAAFTKLAYLLGKGYEGKELRDMMETNLKGEMHNRVRLITGQATLKPINSKCQLEQSEHLRARMRKGHTG